MTNRHKINLERDVAIIRILGEVCWGFTVEEFEKKSVKNKKLLKCV